jgi:hypothetical protein
VAFGATGAPSTWDTARTYVTGRGAVDTDTVEELFVRLEHRIADEGRTGGPDRAVAEVGPAEVDRLAAGDPIARTVLSAWLHSEYENLYAAPLEEVSVRWGTEPFRLPGRDLLLTTSLGEVITAAAEGIDVRCSSRVRTVAVRPDGSTVGLEDGSTLEASDVVVTIPVGALRSGRITFQPSLPDEIRASVDRIGAGPVAKSFFSFDERWWAPETCWFIAGDPPATFNVWVDVSALAGRPVLCAFASGPGRRGRADDRGRTLPPGRRRTVGSEGRRRAYRVACGDGSSHAVPRPRRVRAGPPPHGRAALPRREPSHRRGQLVGPGGQAVRVGAVGRGSRRTHAGTQAHALGQGRGRPRVPAER